MFILSVDIEEGKASPYAAVEGKIIPAANANTPALAKYFFS